MSTDERPDLAIRHRYEVQIAELQRACAAEIEALRATCSHAERTGWLLDHTPTGWGYEKCWRRHCRRCFACLELTYTRPDGATG